MFDKSYIGPNVLGSFSAPAAMQSWSRVVVQVDDDTSYEAGNDTGKTLTVSIPYGTPQLAQDILDRIRGQSYQPYTAETALLDPAAELGDAVEVRSIYGGIYKRDRDLSKLYSATIAAPADEEIDHEYPYKSSQQRQIIRQRKQTKTNFEILSNKIALAVSALEDADRQLQASIQIEADRITQEVTDRISQNNVLSSQITQQAGEIAAKVSKNGGAGSFAYSLQDSFMAWYANGSEIVRFDDNGAKIRGRIEALTGKIGGFDIMDDYLSYNGQQWGGTNTNGIYIGVNGIQAGSQRNGTQITLDGRLYCEEGYFRGSVNAGNIDYGGDAGYFSGGGLSGGSVGAGKIVGNSLSTGQFVGGVNASLSNADTAFDITMGYQNFGTMAGNIMRAAYMYLNGSKLGKTTITYTSPGGAQHTRNVVTWG